MTAGWSPHDVRGSSREADLDEDLDELVAVRPRDLTAGDGETGDAPGVAAERVDRQDRKSTRLNSSHT